MIRKIWDNIYTNISSYLKWATVIGLIIFAVYSLDRGYISGINQWWFIGGIILLVFYFLDGYPPHKKS